MISRKLGLASLLITIVGCSHETPPPAPPPAPAPTVVSAPMPTPLPPPPALRLPATTRPQQYVVSLHMSPKQEVFHGRVDVQVSIAQPTSVIWMNAGDNLRVHGASVNGTPAHVTRANDDIIGIQVDAPVVGNASISLTYGGKLPNRDGRGAYRQEEHGEQYIFTQFESTDARRAFPCFDEPSFKTPFTLNIDAPADQLVFANTPEVSTKPSKDGWKTTSFAPTKPLPSYLVAFAVGPFEVVDGGKAGKNNTPIRIIVPKGRSADAKYAAAQTGKILATLENYFDIPYPFEKLDHIAVPQKGGAMENPGLITYGTATILGKGDEKSTRLEHGYLSIAAHELGHLWFGDLVTTSWWDDTWLNEAFATWISAKIVDTMHPEWEGTVSRVEATNGVMGLDALASTRRIRQPIETKHDIVTAFDNITYRKGGAVIAMMESWVGAEPFRKAVHGYLTKHAYGNATSQEFLADMGAQMDTPHKDFAAAFSSFLDQPGTPFITSTLKCDQNTPRLSLSQKRYLPEGSKGDAKMQWLVPFCAAYPDGKTNGKTCTLLKDDVDMKLDAKTCPAWVDPNADATGYYRAYEEGGGGPEVKLLDNKALSVAERLGVMGDMIALIKSGTLADNTLLAKEGAIMTEGNPHLATMAAIYANNLEESFVNDAAHAKYVAFMKRTLGGTEAKLGWTPKPTDSDAMRLERPVVMSIAARFDDAKAAEAQKMSLAWLDDKKAIDFDLVPAVLDAGARKADKAYWDKLHAAAKKTEDRLERTRLIAAMGHAQDPALAKANLDLALSQEFDPRESITLVYRVADDPKNRQLAWDFVKANYDKLVAPLPWRSGASLAQVAGHFCDETHRTEAEAFFKNKQEKFEGGPRVIAQLLEDMSLCIAEKPRREKSVSEFLAEMSIAFFGTGLLGTGFVKQLRKRGETVHVWNRTLEKAKKLEADGAVVFDDPAAAAKGADRIHLSLSDDRAVDDVLGRAGVTKEQLIVDHTTTSATGTKARVATWDSAGVRFVHAPVFMGPQNAHDATGIMLVSGERARVDLVKPHLAKMTGKVIDLGERVDAAAAFKLFGNCFLMFFTAGLAEVFTLARALDVDPKDAATLFQHFNPGNMIGARIDRMLGAEWEKASWELSMARKDARLMLEEGEHGGHPLHFLPAIAARMDEFIKQGHGNHDWTVIAKDAIDGP